MAIESVHVEQVTKRYGHHRALASVDLTLRAGSLCALLGPNGAGKSTLLGVLSTLVQPTKGRVRFARAAPGETTVSAVELRHQIGVLAHSAFIYGELSGDENLAFYARLYGIADPGSRAASLLDAVGLDTRARARQARTYSRGMLQRLALARALLHDPRVLLLDEPFTGLDRSGAKMLAETLRSARSGKRIVLCITHDLESIGEVTDHVAVLARGKLVHEARNDVGFSYEELKHIYHSWAD